jgi:hypothetical protein
MHVHPMPGEKSQMRAFSIISRATGLSCRRGSGYGEDGFGQTCLLSIISLGSQWYRSLRALPAVAVGLPRGYLPPLRRRQAWYTTELQAIIAIAYCYCYCELTSIQLVTHGKVRRPVLKRGGDQPCASKITRRLKPRLLRPDSLFDTHPVVPCPPRCEWYETDIHAFLPAPRR